MNEFRGAWISHPTNTSRAENKLLQLEVARRAGFRVPKTLVSSDGPAIRRFAAAVKGELIIKPVRGTNSVNLFTTRVRGDQLFDDEAIRLCPAIYQEYIRGRRHLRVQCFGDKIYAAAIDSKDLDWRGNLDVPVTPVELDEQVNAALRGVLADLGLRMGIVDLKLDENGEPVWMEINPQGQFLFVQGLCGLDLVRAFSDFIVAEARQAASTRSSVTRRI